MSNIFISYRRSDSAYVTGAIYKRLVGRFGAKQIFKDVDSIPLGVHFRDYISQVISQCDVALVIIGSHWLDVKDEHGQRRLDNPIDMVRIEVETALERGIPVIPLLVHDASIPRPTDLPPRLADLSYRNGCLVRPDPDFDTDVDRLIASLEVLLSNASARPHLSPPQPAAVAASIPAFQSQPSVASVAHPPSSATSPAPSIKTSPIIQPDQATLPLQSGQAASSIDLAQAVIQNKLPLQPASSAHAYLLMQDGNNPPQRLELDEARTTLGRHPDNSIQLVDGLVSKRHTLIVYQPPYHWIEDLESRNGTLLNQQPVTKDYLYPGDTIQIGNFVLQFFPITSS